MNFFPLHIGDFDSATRHLSRTERSVYFDLLCVYYSDERPLSLDVTTISRRIIARSTEEREALEAVLREFFTESEEGWRNKRADEEIAIYREKCEKAKKSIKARWAKSANHTNELRTNYGRNTNVSKTDTDELRTNYECNTNQEPRTNSTKANALVGDKSPKPKRATQLPADWAPKPSHHELARIEGKDIEREVAQFRDHHLARENTFKNWDLAFNTWLRNNFGSKPQSRVVQMNALLHDTHAKDYGTGGKQ